MHWLNEPRRWTASDDRIEIVTEERTDFWQGTFYGWRRDTGHFAYETVKGDFTAEVVFGADYRDLYDQAGLMLRISPECWLKTGVEFAHGAARVGAVLTRDGRSDWSIGQEVAAEARVRLRLTRTGDAVCVQWAPDGVAAGLRTIRLGYLTNAPDAMVGPMACSPTRAGLVARFVGFRTGPAVDVSGEV